MAIAGLAFFRVNELVLISSLLYLCADVLYEWDALADCSQPVNLWLLGSYLLVVVFRCVYVTGSLEQSDEDSGNFLLNLRQKSRLSRYAVKATWFVLVPLFSLWTIIGTAWLLDVRNNTPTCLPSGSHLWFLVVWQVLSYAWMLIHGTLGLMAWLLELRVRKAESDLRQIEDAELLSRWGHVSQLTGYTTLQKLISPGLSPEEIHALPSFTVLEPRDKLNLEGFKNQQAIGDECSICLNAFKPGDPVRKLPVCGHNFHRCCIDLWLLRSSSCPLCKRNVLKMSGDRDCMCDNADRKSVV